MFARRNLTSIYRRWMPGLFRRAVRRRLDLSGFERRRRFEREGDLLEAGSWEGIGELPRLGIFREFFQYHKDYVRACREMGVSYALLDLSSSDWIERVRESGCAGFLVWPSSLPVSWNRMFKERVKLLNGVLGIPVFPSCSELWLYESKYRVRDWLDVKGFPYPRTWIFFEEEEALRFARETDLPVVAKTDSGGSASGVRVFANRKRLRAYTRRAFRAGVTLSGHGPFERMRGSVLFQEHLQSVKEWRMVRIADSYFGYRKEPGRSGLHSASKRWSWLDPPRELLELTHEVTESGQFRSMNLDVFETVDGQYLVNELQTVFGATTPADQLRVDGRPGRYRREDGVADTSRRWVFEEGDFCRNALCNLRIAEFLRQLGYEDVLNANQGVD